MQSMSRRRRRSGGISAWLAACPLLFGLLLSGTPGCAKPPCVGELPPRPLPSDEAIRQEILTVPEGSPLWLYLSELDRYLDAIGAPL